MLKIFITVALATMQFTVFGELVVKAQPKSQVPSNKNIVVGIEGVDSVNDAIGEIDQVRLSVANLTFVVNGIRTNVYTKAETDDAIFNGTVTIRGNQTITGSKTFQDGIILNTITNVNTGASVSVQINSRELQFWDGVDKPSDARLIRRVILPSSSGNLITDTDIRTLIEILLNPLDGRRVNMGIGSFEETTSPNDNSDGLAYIYFTADALGANDGDYLTSLTFRTRTTGSVTPRNICLAFFDKADASKIQLSYTGMQNVTATGTDYKFVLVEPMLLAAGKTYAALFRLGQGIDNDNCPLGLALIKNQPSSNELFVGFSNSDRRDLRPICKATWYTPATKRAIQTMIDKSK